MMDHTNGGGLFLDLEPSARHHLPPPPTQPMSLFSDDDNDSPKKISAWQRMKWSDDIVRLLISLVASIGEDNIGSLMQKKGKWKMVSKLMMQKGCYVSPQQCEDKFNDLNKRYKRLNEILGRGTSCQVVENPALLDSMTQVSRKGRDDVRRILSSKHLFYREMCAYHDGQRVGDSKIGFLKYDEEENEEENDDEEEEDEGCGRQDFSKVGYDRVFAEIDLVVKDLTKSVWERRVWIRKRILMLQEERVGMQLEAFELEKRRMKWKRFCNKKDWELESLRVKNERLCLENERMTLQIRHKELELESFGAQVEGERVGVQSGVGKIH